MAYFISEVAEEVFYAPYEGYGRRKSPYDPGMMLKILMYAYASGVFSSRKIAKKLEELYSCRFVCRCYEVLYANPQVDNLLRIVMPGQDPSEKGCNW